MIQPNDLKINNLVFFNDSLFDEKHIVRVTGIIGNDKAKTTPQIWYENKECFGSTDKFEDINPIPLTEDVLLKCGFKKIPHLTVTNSLILDIGRDRLISIGCVNDCNQMAWLQHRDGKNITDLVCIHNYDYDGWLHLHQLQNLYFALTNQELEICL